jgi:hypothetical protein
MPQQLPEEPKRSDGQPPTQCTISGVRATDNERDRSMRAYRRNPRALPTYARRTRRRG